MQPLRLVFSMTLKDSTEQSQNNTIGLNELNERRVDNTDIPLYGIYTLISRYFKSRDC